VFKLAEIKTMAALGRPVGTTGQQSTIIFSGSANLKIPRKLLPNSLIQWLIQKTGHLHLPKGFGARG